MRRIAWMTLTTMAVTVTWCGLTLAQSPPAQSPPTQSPPPPVPRPFPGSAQPNATRPPDPAPAAGATVPAPAADVQAAPVPPGTPAELARVPIYPSAEYLDSFDAGRGQRYYLFGVNATYATIVAYYKKAMGNGGRELFRTPGMQQFDLGRFQEETMAFPPSVVVKDYAWGDSTGYLFVRGLAEKRYQTIIQIVPPAGPVK